MCCEWFKNWFKKPKPPDPIPIDSELFRLAFGCNDYSGSDNDLNGCLNDLKNAGDTILKYWNKLISQVFKDSEVIKSRFIGQIEEAFKQQWDTVLLFMDCCFSEDNTRNFRLDLRSRYMPPEGRQVIRKIRKHIGRGTAMNWIAFSACQDYQTAADAYISGSYNGAFTYCAMKSLIPGITYRQWYQKTKDLLDKSGFEQIPEIQGPDSHLDKIVFSDKTLIIQYSGHGTYKKDYSGDEADGQDEALYLYDGPLLDDELDLSLSKIQLSEPII